MLNVAIIFNANCNEVYSTDIFHPISFYFSSPENVLCKESLSPSSFTGSCISSINWVINSHSYAFKIITAILS